MSFWRGDSKCDICPGVLHTLDKKMLIQQFDYPSTVSGGGFIGSWLMALLHRLRPKKIEADTEILEGVASREDEVAGREGDRNKIEPAAIEFLRENSNYLTLKKALLSREDIPQDGDSPKRGIMDISGYLWFRLLAFLLALFFLTSWLSRWNNSKWYKGRMLATPERGRTSLRSMVWRTPVRKLSETRL
jgi:hypothetical protein